MGLCQELLGGVAIDIPEQKGKVCLLVKVNEVANTEKFLKILAVTIELNRLVG